jgi:hypothetical protein
MIKYVFTKEEVDACKLFSEAVDTSHYSKRGQNNDQKRQKDALIGKLGEVATYHSLKDKIHGLTIPDFKIYSAKEKSWDFDLKGQEVNVHVKTQDVEQGEKYGVSWIFQYGNGKNQHYDKEIFDKLTPNQYVVFVSLSLKDNLAIIRAILKLEFLHERKLFGLPKLEFLQKENKKAVYLKDIERYSDQLFQL